MSQTSIELRAREEGSSQAEDLDLTSTHEFSSLPPVDGGKDAWFFLAASFMVEALTWGELYVYVCSCTDTDMRSRLSVCIWCLSGLLQYQCTF
jgi:hypothetical protein